MSYSPKTLIFFDTNTIRDTDSGSLIYKNFSLGGFFRFTEDFINKNQLSGNVHLAVSKLAIEELKDQKVLQYQTDLNSIKSLIKRIEGLPHIPKDSLRINDNEFDCKAHIDSEADKYISSKNILILNIPDDKASSVLKSMITRVLKQDGKRNPFITTGNPQRQKKDVGFKDNVIWESLLIFDSINTYDKIIFVTDDNGFNDICEIEFKDKWGKHFIILRNELSIETELRKDYGNFIDFRQFYEYSEKEYFQEFLNGFLKKISLIQLPEGEFSVENYRVINPCSKVERVSDSEGDFEIIQINTLVEIDTTFEREKKKIPTLITTLINEENIIININTNPPLE